ncbi:peptide transporter family 1 [Ceratina calcarata]|uniref:Oligopeptide transporter 1 n=1 Tax=Ceratina calcarata TaxID=156304 RepID=A0AAJ7IZW4_9HYME|nr:peptide transporter family 1 [Ceratina calcarata]
MVAKTQKKPMKYPRSIFFIISNEFCERFSFYGMRTVLTLYLKDYLKKNDTDAMVIYHVFTMFVYFFPIFGAMIADAVLGKFRTILYLSIVYALGQVLLSLSAVPPLGIPSEEFSFLGLILIALGTGGIKPCVAAFGGDQFVLPQQERYLSTFFSLFYFSINSGSLISSFLTPVLRSNVACFGDNSCYSLAFFVPAVLMSVSIIIFICGRPLYKILKPTGNVVLDVSKCVSHAIYRRVKTSEKRDHWLDHADDEYDGSLINDIKAALKVMVLFIPIPVFWALFDQQGSRWTIQATRMNGEIGSYIFLPDQMQVLNPLLVLIFIPLFEVAIYPLMEKIGLRTPLKKLTIGGLLAALSFVISAIVELNLEPTYPVLPSEGLAQLRVFNTLNCPVNVTVPDNLTFIVDNMKMSEFDIPVKYTQDLNYKIDFSKCKEAGILEIAEKTGSIPIHEARANSWAINPVSGFFAYEDSIDKSSNGDPFIRSLIYVDPKDTSGVLDLRNEDGKSVLKWDIQQEFNVTDLSGIKPGIYDIYFKNEKVKSNVRLQLGGVYTVVGSLINGKPGVDVVTVTEPNSLHIMWLIPQYIVITMGEVMFSVTGLEFAFTQAPISMKSLLQATWLLTVAFGNLIVVIIAEISIFNRQFYEILLFAGLMFVDIIIFAVMAKFYKYVEIPEESSISEEINMELKGGQLNASYKDDEK